MENFYTSPGDALYFAYYILCILYANENNIVTPPTLSRTFTAVSIKIKNTARSRLIPAAS